MTPRSNLVPWGTSSTEYEQPAYAIYCRGSCMRRLVHGSASILTLQLSRYVAVQRADLDSVPTAFEAGPMTTTEFAVEPWWKKSPR